MIHHAGTPIKNRGIKWVENYGDKSAYLKEEFEAQVGPGSYFRWEGHDYTTSTDYYVVVTPGFSKKHGYHFFAGLRKEPAENGASGKHFHTQGEALSYAMDKWNVPRPQTAPHKPYVSKDLEGKPIVTENVHAGSESDIVRISGKDGSMVIIDATEDEIVEASTDEPMEKTAMALHSMKAPRFIPQYGSLTLPAVYQNAARANSIMGLRAALRTKLEYITMDNNNWDKDAKGNNDLTGQLGTPLPDSPLMATCEDVDQAEFDRVVNQNGLSIRNKLFEFSRSGALNLSQPSGTTSSGNYNIVRFSHVAKVRPNIKVSFANKAAFDAIVDEFHGMTGIGSYHPIIMPSERREGTPESHDYKYSAEIPIDLYAAFKARVAKLASVSAPKNYDVDNAIKLYNYYDKQGQASTPADKNRIMQTPMFEEYKGIKGGHALSFDKRGVPLGIDVARSNRIGMEGENQKAKMYVLKKTVLDSWNAQHNGDWERVRQGLFDGSIPIDHTMFVDSRTCAPKMMRVMSKMPKVGMDLFPETENGQLQYEIRNVAPEYTIAATEGVRVLNPQTGKLHYRNLPGGVHPEQNFNHLPVVLNTSKNYVPVQTADGRTEIREVNIGEWDMHDSESYGKFIPGECYRFGITPKNASSKKTDVKNMHELGLRRGGWGIYTAKTCAEMDWHEGPPRDEDQRAAAQELVTDSAGNVIGYYGCVQRQYPNKAWSTAAPTARDPIEIPVHEQDANGNLIRTNRTFALTEADAYKDSEADGIMINSLPKAVKYLQYKYGLSDQAFGPIPNVSDVDLHTIDEKVSAALSKIEAVRAGRLNDSALEPWERLLSAFPKGNTIPPEFFSAMVEAQDDPQSWEPKLGSTYGVFNTAENNFIEGEEFATPEKAESFKAFLSSRQEFEGASLEVRVLQENVPLTKAYREALAQDPHAEFVTNKDAYEGFEDLVDDEETLQPSNGPEAPETEAPPTENPVEQPSLGTQPELQVSDTPYEGADLLEHGLEPAMAPATPTPAVPPKRPDLNKPKTPLPDTEASLHRLIKLADRLDDEGKIEESQAVDRLIATLSRKFTNGN